MRTASDTDIFELLGLEPLNTGGPMMTHDEAMEKATGFLSAAERASNDETARLLALAEMWLKVAAWIHTAGAGNKPG